VGLVHKQMRFSLIAGFSGSAQEFAVNLVARYSLAAIRCRIKLAG